ncbi:hypothetical protein WBG78_16515 [Chryseolinea sp. T2]|uniref:hypothetical protein n=1 Tax=Chryseolinea sp. T2 TaxID=3129255 RepID=UPI00307847D6
MKRKLGLLFLLGLCVLTATAQKVTPLFQSKEAINLRATGSVKSIKKKTNDSTFVSVKFEYEESPEKWKTLPTEARVRGNFRLRYCYFPPLKVKFSKDDIDSTLFHGNKSLKIVMPCRITSDMNQLIRREYICYKFYETVSPYHFLTRLANLHLTEVTAKKPREYDLLTFLVEDNSNVAKRSNGKIMEVKGLSPAAFEEKQALRNDYFQYMISNADWSAVYQHNTNVLYADSKYITLSYDFDMSGFVNAYYARENPPNLGTGDIRDRVYRGFCKSPEAMQEIRKEYLDKETELQGLIDEQKEHFSEVELKDMHNFTNDFFDIFRDDYRFKTKILDACRTEK